MSPVPSDDHLSLPGQHLVGRSDELLMLAERFNQTGVTGGGLILVSGEAGIGKSALVEAFLESTASSSTNILRGACYDLSSTPPYGLWLDLIERSGADELRHALLEAPGRGSDDGHTSGPFEPLRPLRDELLKFAGSDRLVVLLEDIHWADQASLELLRSLSRQLSTTPILAIATYRDDELTRNRFLHDLLPVLIRESDGLRIELAPIDRAAVSEIASRGRVMSSRDTERLVDYLLTNADGNPLLTIELIRTLEHERSMVRSEAGWEVRDLSSVTVPPLVRQVIERRLSTLDAATRATLEVASVLGQSVQVSILERVAPCSRDRLFEAIEQASNLGLVKASTHENRIEFNHALTREAIYTAISPPTRASLHRTIAEVLAALPGRAPDEIAYHFKNAEDIRAIDWLIEAGERAQRAYAWHAAGERFRDAVDLMEQLPSEDRRRAWLLCHLGWILRHTDRAEGIQRLEASLRLARAISDAALEAIALMTLGLVHAHSGKMAQGIAEMSAGLDQLDRLDDTNAPQPFNWIVDSTLGAIHSDATVRFRYTFRGTTAGWMSITGRAHEALAIAARHDEMVDRLERSDPETAARIGRGTWDLHGARAASFAILGEVEKATKCFDEALRLYRENLHYFMVAVESMHRFSYLILPWKTRDISERHRTINEIRSSLERSRSVRSDDISPDIALLPELYLSGKWNEARQIFASGLGLFESFWMITIPAWISHYQGNDNPGRTFIESQLPNGPMTEPGDMEFLTGLDTILLAATIALENHDLLDAQRWLDCHQRWVEWSQCLISRPQGILARARLARAGGDRILAEQHANEARDIASDPEQPLALLAIDRFLGELAIERNDLPSAEQHLHNSLDISGACGAAFDIAWTSVILAEICVASGDRDSAQRIAAEVARTAQNMGARPLHDRAQRIVNLTAPQKTENRFGLTSREMDVFRLVALGRSDKQIAAELFISPHTVMRHVSAILRKLDVESRTAAVSRGNIEGLL